MPEGLPEVPPVIHKEERTPFPPVYEQTSNRLIPEQAPKPLPDVKRILREESKEATDSITNK